jgi:hypothetical protein
MADQSIVAITKEYLRALQGQGIPISFGILFGSWAHGIAHRWSDIDLVVVSPLYDTSRSFKDVSVLWCQAARTDSRIEPIACGEKEWEADNTRVILEIARKEGERIVLDEETVPLG